MQFGNDGKQIVWLNPHLFFYKPSGQRKENMLPMVRPYITINSSYTFMIFIIFYYMHVNGDKCWQHDELCIKCLHYEIEYYDLYGVIGQSNQFHASY